MITSKGLEYFYLVASLGSIRAASLKLRISPSAISRQISLLEDEIGLELGVRHARGIHLTEAGQTLFKHVHASRREEEILQETLAAMRGLTKGTVRIVAGDGFGNDLITNVLPTFRDNLPQIEVALSFGVNDHVLKSVSEDESDIGLAYGSDIPTGVKCLHRVKRPIVVAYSKAGHKVMRESGLSLLLKKDVALPPIFSGSRQVLERALAAVRLEMKSSVTIPTVDGLLAYVIACNGYAVVPKFSVSDPRFAGMIASVPIDLEIASQTEASLIVRADRKLPPAVVEMTKQIEARLAVFSQTASTEPGR